MIRTVHLQLKLGYPWNAPLHKLLLENVPSMKGLQNLCIVGEAGGMIDLKDNDLIDANLWKNKKHIFLKLFRKFEFIRNVDIYLPMMHSILMCSKETVVPGARLHGFTIKQRSGKEPALCSCTLRPEKLYIPPFTEDGERE
jgi:hypothetical protein